MHNSLVTKSVCSILSFGTAFILFFFIFVSFASAETPGLMLVTDPLTPEPNSVVTVSLNDYSLNTVGSSVSWYVDAKEKVASKNARSIEVTTGNPGKKTTVRVVLSRPDAPSLSTTLTIVPSKVDIILEASTYVPHFYAGRALPTRDSMMRVIAVVNNGSNLVQNNLVYKWTIDSSALFGGASKGKNVLDLAMPHYDDVVLGVEVFASTGERIGEGSVLLKAVEPELHFYEFSPLRGLYEREVQSPFQLLSEETTIYGEPYFIDAKMNEADAVFTWSLNNQRVDHDSSVPNALTLRHVGGGGDSLVGLRVVTTKAIPQLITKAFQVNF